jgi:hypothetical protein
MSAAQEGIAARKSSVFEKMATLDFCFWHKADVQTALVNNRFEGNNGHDADVARCLLMTRSIRNRALI